jgi:peptide-methionine (S)-S-oxide reductase
MMIRFIFILLATPFLFTSCEAQTPGKKQTARTQPPDSEVMRIDDYLEKMGRDHSNLEVATFAGGCFWCTEASFDRINGVVNVISGYSGGEKEYPTYREVANKLTKHAEAIQIYYDPEIVSFETLLEVFFVAHDPTTLNRQGPDVGPQYRSAIFYHDATQQELAQAAIDRLNQERFNGGIVTELSPYDEFWTAEGYHQDYYEFNPNNPYVRNVSKPKVEKVKKTFKDILKEGYQ